MGSGINQRAFVMLAVNFDERAAEAAQHLHTDWLVVDECAGAAVSELHAPHDELVLDGNIVRRQQGAGRMVGRNVKRGGDLALLGAGAHEAGVAARTKGQREGVKQDRLACASLAGEHRQAGGKIDIEAIDQDDVADREPGQHQAPSHLSPPRKPARFRAVPDSYNCRPQHPATSALGGGNVSCGSDRQARLS